MLVITHRNGQEAGGRRVDSDAELTHIVYIRNIAPVFRRPQTHATETFTGRVGQIIDFVALAARLKVACCADPSFVIITVTSSNSMFRAQDTT